MEKQKQIEDCKNCPYALDWYKETLRKETAREILSLLYTAIPKTQIVVEIAKQYGVEVE